MKNYDASRLQAGAPNLCPPRIFGFVTALLLAVGLPCKPADAAELTDEEDDHGDISWTCGVDHSHDAVSVALGQDGDVSIQSAWTEGVKKILFIRVNYSDDADTPVTLTTLTNRLSASSTFFQANSYGRTRLAQFNEGSAATPVLMMPQPKTWYTSSRFNDILSHARTAAANAGYNNSAYDFHVVCSKKTAVTTANALAKVGSSGVLMNGSFVATLLTHELGHNYGVWHANFWESTNPYGIGSGSNLEYGDIYDIMGGDASGWDLSVQHFNTDHKTRLDWIKSSEFATVTGSGGLYRIYTHDNVNSLGKGLLAVKIPINTSRNFWVEYRRLVITDSGNWLINGAGLRWGYNATTSNGSRLIDTTPGSRTGGAKADRRDSPIAIGRTFSDFENNIHITPIGLGGTSPQSIDVRVNLGAFAGNRPPVATLSGRTSAMVGETLTFTMSASDPDGDQLAYFWDFANDMFDSANSPTRNKSWSSPGTYTVRCTVSDMKGGEVTQSLTVTVTTTPAPPAITTQPQSQTNTVGANVTFNVTATGTAPLAYQWRFNSTNIANATGTSYTRNNIQLSDAGNYSVIVSNGGGSVISSTAMLTVNPPPEANVPPVLEPIENRTVFAGSALTFTCAASDPNPADILTFSLDPGAPPTASIHPSTGVFNWTPANEDTNSVHYITVRVTDNGSPQMSGAATFAVTVEPAPPPNHGPLLFPIASFSVHSGMLVTFTNVAYDPNPDDTLTFSLDPGAPGSAEVGAEDGVFTWTPRDEDAGTVRSITVRVTDDGYPPLSGSASFSVTVHPRPVLQNVAVSGGTAVLTWNAIPGMTYRVEYKNNLDDSDWEALDGDVNADGPVATAHDNGFGANGQRFYRILLVQSD